MLRHSRLVVALPLCSLVLLGCHAQEDDSFRSYTTNTSWGDGPACEDEPVVDVAPRRSLIETSPDALSGLSIQAVSEAIGVNGGLAPNSLHLINTIVGPFDDAACPGYVSPAPIPGIGSSVIGLPGINGYPILCERYEEGAVWGWQPLAAVNRFDLAPADGSNCGEARLVFGSKGQNEFIGYAATRRMAMIVEAKIPNPAPECGIEACRHVQEFWASLSDIDDPAVRADELTMAFIDGHPDLQAKGFGPFMSWEHLTFGTGQVRANAFHTSPRTLREFKLVPSTNAAGFTFLGAAEVPVAGNPFGELWSDAAHPYAETCQDAIVASVPLLMADDPNRLGLDLPPECLAGESPDLALQDYHAQLLAGGTGPGSLHARIEQAIAAHDPASTLTAQDLAERASLLGCIGCHGRVSPGTDLGEGMTAHALSAFASLPSGVFTVVQANPVPLPGTGQHVSETVLTDCGDGTECYAISEALEHSFLPFRESVMEQFLADTACCQSELPQCCDAPPPPPPCDPTVEFCGPLEGPEEGPIKPCLFAKLCEPTGPAQHKEPELEAALEMEADVGPGLSLVDGTTVEGLGVEQLLRLEDALRRRSPITTSGRPSGSGH